MKKVICGVLVVCGFISFLNAEFFSNEELAKYNELKAKWESLKANNVEYYAKKCDGKGIDGDLCDDIEKRLAWLEEMNKNGVWSAKEKIGGRGWGYELNDKYAGIGNIWFFLDNHIGLEEAQRGRDGAVKEWVKETKDNYEAINKNKK